MPETSREWVRILQFRGAKKFLVCEQMSGVAGGVVGKVQVRCPRAGIVQWKQQQLFCGSHLELLPPLSNLAPTPLPFPHFSLPCCYSCALTTKDCSWLLVMLALLLMWGPGLYPDIAQFQSEWSHEEDPKLWSQGTGPTEADQRPTPGRAFPAYAIRA